MNPHAGKSCVAGVCGSHGSRECALNSRLKGIQGPVSRILKKKKTKKKKKKKKKKEKKQKREEEEKNKQTKKEKKEEEEGAETTRRGSVAAIHQYTGLRETNKTNKEEGWHRKKHLHRTSDV